MTAMEKQCVCAWCHRMIPTYWLHCAWCGCQERLRLKNGNIILTDGPRDHGVELTSKDFERT